MITDLQCSKHLIYLMLMKVTILLDNARSMLNISVVLPVDLDLDSRYDVYKWQIYMSRA